MFLGASLIPDYFSSKINLFVALAPVANTAFVDATMGVVLAPYISWIEFFMVRLGKMYNWFDPSYGTAMINKCESWGLKHFCLNLLENFFFNSTVDNKDRMPVFFYKEPSGQSWRTFIYYAQMMNSKRYCLYDYGKRKNKKIYGSEEPPLVPIEDLNIPVGIFSGSLDHIGDPQDVAFLVEKLGDKAVFYKEYELDHYSFALANDVTFMEDAI